MNVNDSHRDMARLAVERRVDPRITTLGDASQHAHREAARALPELRGHAQGRRHYLCVNCSHIFNVIQAYKNTRIAYGAVEMDRLTAEEWKIVNQIKAERDKAKDKAGAA